MKKGWQLIGKLLFIGALIAMVVYTFKDSAGDIVDEISRTSMSVIIAICAMSVLYELIEGWVTYSLAKEYNPCFRYYQGVESAFYISFYRTATLGSGAAVAAIHYFNEHDIPYSKGLGFYVMEYMIHKVSIAIFTGIFFVLNWDYMMLHFSSYKITLIIGFVVTFLIAVGLILFVCSAKFHNLLIRLLGLVNRNGKLTDKIAWIEHQCRMMEDAASTVLAKKKVMVTCVCKNLVKLAFWYAIPYLILEHSYDITLMQSLAITSLAMMLAAVIPAPAGIGSSEFVFIMLLTGIIGTGAAGSVTLLYRFATFVVPFLIGGVIAAGWNRLNRIRKMEE